MKTFKLIVLVAAIVLNATSKINAQGPATEECMQNLSLFTTSCKQKNYADALAPWENVYQNCPTAHKNIYVLGVRIVNWQISQTQDPTEKKALFEKLMRLHDEQIQHFGQNQTDRASILARKAQYYLAYNPKDRKTVYPWYKEAMEILQYKANVSIFQQFVVTSSELYKADTTLAEMFINDFTFANTHLETLVANPAVKNHTKYVELKNSLDALFVLSGAADCKKLNEIYKDAIEANKDNNDYLIRTMRFFKRLDCTQEEAYFSAAKYSHAISPSAESAIGLGNMSYGKDEFKEAIKYYTDAVKLFETDEDKADAMFRIAQCYYELKNNIKTREYCKESIKLNSAKGAPYIILGLIYGSGADVSEDPILNKAKYWVAVDQFVKAKNAEENPKLQAQANKFINTFKAHYPSTEEIFMHDKLTNGATYFVGGWINENTTIRAK